MDDAGPRLVDRREAALLELEGEIDVLEVAEAVGRVEAALLGERLPRDQEAGGGAVVDLAPEPVLECAGVGA